MGDNPLRNLGLFHLFHSVRDFSVCYRFLAVLITCLVSFTTYAQRAALVSVDEVVEQQFTKTVPVLGRLVVKQSGTVASQISGSVSEILIAVGDKVTKGQLLATIDPSLLLLQKQLADSRLIESKARVKTAYAQWQLTEQELNRLEGLKDTAAISQATYDNARQQHNIASSRVDEAQAAIHASEANLKLAELQLSYTSIHAPFNGTVVKKLTEVGSFLQRGQSVAQLISDDSLELEADVPASQLSGLSSSTPVIATLDNGASLSAQVRAVIPEENPRTRTRRVRFSIEFDDATGPLASDQSVSVHIPAGENKMVLTVHKDAVIRKGTQQIVYVIEDNTARLTPIQTGQSIDNRLEVIQGLQQGNQVVTRGNERLTPDQAVTIGQ